MDSLVLVLVDGLASFVMKVVQPIVRRALVLMEEPASKLPTNYVADVHLALKETTVKASNVLKLQVFSLIHKAADIFIIATGILPTERIALETCTSTGKSKCPIVADYVIDVKFIKFENYNRLLANGRTCSNFGSQQCQTTLHVCARPDDTSTLCRYGETKTGVIGDNVIDLNKTFIGTARNPITYLIRQPFQKFVVSFTAKSNNELIAEYVYQSGYYLPQRSVEEARYKLITTRGSQNPTTQLTYQIRSYCSQGYYGTNCITRCYIPTSEQTRFQCDINGQKVCKPGFTGPFCPPDGIRDTV
ncbi:locus notch homolog 1-like isoform X1 [Octopus vulgaris]|uniref:Locus notch homolog 1-like isoform X1 n=1 Tax=Octopus vulgaris TaxID=6645 RepID=A0AA36F6T0_OCTVU|nr:locus notch homolog 1-like isoform X1 [Octopus vulgaris]